MMLADKFEDLFREFSEVGFNSEPVLFSREKFPDLDEVTQCNDLNIVSRQRFVSNGLVDNLIVETNKKTAQIFGLWLLSAVFQRKYSAYRIKLNSSDGVVNEIKFVLKKTSKIVVEPISFEWQPCNIEEFVGDNNHYFGDVPRSCLTNSVGEWRSTEEFQARNILEIVSSNGGAIFLAEFFLNIGIRDSNVNYEYLNYEYARNVLSDDSCEIRVEVIHKFAGIQDIASSSVN